MHSQFTEDLIEGRAGIHDRHQVELKLDYAIDPTRRRNRYQVDAFFFVPSGLGITPETYPREQILADVQAHIRFKTPDQTLPSMLDGRNEQSVLQRLIAKRERVGDLILDRDERSALSQEIRLFGCLVRARIRDRSRVLVERVEALGAAPSPPDLQVDDLADGVRSLLDDTRRVLAAFRELRSDLARPDLPGWLREAFTYTDEYLSLVAEDFFTRMLAAVDAAPRLAPRMADARAALSQRVREETEHRRAAGYGSVLGPESANEHFEYRRGLLKKFVNSVLFLEVTKEKEGRRAADIAAAGAAAIAMIVATVAAIAAQQLYGVNTVPFVVALVAAYMVKDRLKDWLRQFFSSKMSPFLADYSVRIFDPLTGVGIGRCREAVAYLPARAVPKAVVELRHRDATSASERRSKRETVIHYRKSIRISGDAVEASRRRLRDVNDIIRFSLASMLSRGDDPRKRVAWLDPEQDRVVTLELPRVYHINVVLRLRAMRRGVAPVMERVRIIVDRDGIQRLEHP